MAALPQIVLKKGKAKPVEARHPWIFAASVGKVRGDPRPGDLVEVCDPAGTFVGTGYYNPRSQIVVRILSWDQAEEITPGFVKRRLAQAMALRDRIGIPARTDAYRLVHSEGDGLPGLVVDRYGDWLAVQVSTAGMDKQAEAILEGLEEICAPKGIYGRPDSHACELEGIAPRAGLLRGEAPPPEIIVREDGIRFAVDLVNGQKTGFYCDQRDNRRRVGELATGRRVLDAFSYSGGFALHAAKGGARQVIAFESAAEALALAGRNRQLNDATVTLLQGEVFWELQNLVHRGEKFGIVVLDPPKFVRDRDGLGKGLDGYRTINTLGAMLTEPGGILVTCSCSGLVTEDLFTEVLLQASMEAGREIQVLERRGQPPDHPVALGCPEGRYLKCLVCAVA